MDKKYDYPSLGERFRKEWKIFAVAFVIIFIAEFIGKKEFGGATSKIILFPMLYAIVMGVLSGPKLLKVLDEETSKRTAKLIIIGLCPFMVNLGISAGKNIEIIANVGPVLLLHGLGNLLSILVALPIAMLLGMGREGLGATLSMNRESQLALVNDQFGAESPESRGSLAMYIIGGMVGTIFFGIIANLVAMTGIFSPESMALGSGVGAAIMMASASASLANIYPEMQDTILTLASVGEALASITGIYMYLFIGIPLARKYYGFLQKFIRPKRNQEASK